MIQHGRATGRERTLDESEGMNPRGQILYFSIY